MVRSLSITFWVVLAVLCPVVLHAQHRVLWEETPLFTSLADAKQHKSEVYRLHLQGLAEVPTELSRFKNLCELRLTNGKISALPAWVGKLESLEILDLEGNALAVLPAFLGQIKGLCELNVAKNKITALPANNWAKFEKLNSRSL